MKTTLPPGTTNPGIDAFLKTVLRSGLLDREQVQSTVRLSPQECRNNAVALAEFFIKSGKLTRFQAQKLLQGVSLGLVLGPFQILSHLGSGGMGKVYLARDSRNRQLVALKILPPKRLLEDEKLLTRFRREMEMSKLLSHPHLAQSFEAGCAQNVHYIAMEFIPGKSLFHLVAEEGPLKVPRAARLFAEAASGLEHAHQKGLIHRDLKPSNIMITPHDHAKVLDLGFAIIQGEDHEDRAIIGGQGYVVGTMDYIAPEQALDSAHVDPRSDLYGLGCTLYFALTGSPPFPGGNTLDKIHCHRTKEPMAIEFLNANVAPEFIGVVQKMMAKRPEDRYASAAQLRQSLLAWTTVEPVQPLDQKSDAEYAQAVADLNDADLPPEQLWGAIVTETAPVDEPEYDPIITLSRQQADGFWSYCKRFWYLFALGLVIPIVGGYFLLRR